MVLTETHNKFAHEHVQSRLFEHFQEIGVAGSGCKQKIRMHEPFQHLAGGTIEVASTERDKKKKWKSASTWQIKNLEVCKHMAS